MTILENAHETPAVNCVVHGCKKDDPSKSKSIDSRYNRAGQSPIFGTIFYYT